MTRQALLDESPKVFQALERFLDVSELARMSLDYQHARESGGNAEPGVMREEGVSYNPRLARLLSIAAVDIGLEDFALLRATLYAAVVWGGGVKECESRYGGLQIPEELIDCVASVCDPSKGLAESSLIRGVITLDSVRHLHQTSYSLTERTLILEDVERNVVEPLYGSVPEKLMQKLHHALTLQRRRLEADRSKAHSVIDNQKR